MLDEIEFFRCIRCGKNVERPGRLRCEACEAKPEALHRTIAKHMPLTDSWARIWRMLPDWQTAARRYAEKRMQCHKAAMETASHSLKAQTAPLALAALEREIDRREIGTAHMVAHHEHVGLVNEARRGIEQLRAMADRMRL